MNSKAVQSPFITREPANICWNRIGTNGNNSCESIHEFTICTNCPVFKEATHILLNRKTPFSYNINQSNEERINTQGTEHETLYLFALNNFILGLPSAYISKTTVPSPIHSIPKRTSRQLLGLMNIEGSIFLTFSLLDIIANPKDIKSIIKTVNKSAFIFSHPKITAAFPVSETIGLYHAQLNPHPKKNTQDLLHPFLEDFCKQSFIYQQKNGILLDHELLAESIIKKYL